MLGRSISDSLKIMEFGRRFFFPKDSLCSDSEGLAARGLNKEDFDIGSNVELKAVTDTCSDCPIQLDCFDDAVDSIQKGLRILGVRAGISTTDIGRMMDEKDLNPTRRQIEVRQRVAQAAIRGSVSSR